MSFHRVLPLPIALSNQDPENRSATEPALIVNARIMTDDKSESASEKTKSLQSAPSVASKSLPSISSQEASQTKQDHALRSSGAELEDYQSPKIRTRSLIKPAKRDSRQSSKGQTSTPNKNADAWQGESPSSICLCQPDPKVPRPRNGMYLYTSAIHDRIPIPIFGLHSACRLTVPLLTAPS